MFRWPRPAVPGTEPTWQLQPTIPPGTACATIHAISWHCPLSIYELKKPVNGAHPFKEQSVSIGKALVTGLAGTHFFVQVIDEERATGGVDYSGVYVLSRTAPRVGEHVRISKAVLKDNSNSTMSSSRSWTAAIPCRRLLPLPRPRFARAVLVQRRSRVCWWSSPTSS